MRTAEMIAQIDAAVADENRSHRCRALLADFAQRNGRKPTAQEFDGAIQFIVDYIKHVPSLMIAMDATAKVMGFQVAIKPLLDACEQYWFTEFDVIPDKLGLPGYSDDAYYALSIIQEIAERYRQPNGEPLLNLQMREANQVMRGLIGEPGASVLDAGIQAVVAGPALLEMLSNLPIMRQPLVASDPIWGNASPAEIANIQLGAMGVI